MSGPAFCRVRIRRPWRGRTRWLLLHACVAGAATGCGVRTPRPALTPRYREVRPPTTAAPGTASVSLFSLAPSREAANAVLLDLSPAGQAALLTELGKRVTSAGELFRAASSTAGGAAAPTREDRHVVRRRLVLSVEHVRAGPADRLAAVRITLRPDPSVRFSNWDRLVTKYETADLGKMTFTQQRGGEYGLGAATTDQLVGALTLTPSVKTTDSRTLAEEVQLRQRYVVSTGALTPDSAVVIQEGAPGIDLTGNVLLEAELRTTTTTTVPVWAVAGVGRKSDGVVDCAARPTLERRYVTYTPGAPAVRTATLAMQYVVRHVVDGAGTMEEGDDVVEYRTGAVGPVRVELAPPDALAFPRFVLRVGPHALDLRDAAGAETVHTAAYEDVAALAAWLRRCGPAPFDDRTLTADGRPVSAAQLAAVRVERVGAP